MSGASIPIIKRASRFPERIAIRDQKGEHNYAKLERASHAVASALLEKAKNLNEERIAFLVPPSFDYVAIQWGIWRAGGIAVPLCPAHPSAEMEHVIQESGTTKLVYHPDYIGKISPLLASINVLEYSTAELMAHPAGPLPAVKNSQRAMMLFTSGTTGKPKGVVSTHANIDAQIKSLVEAWDWKPEDQILHILPLHHTHGIINKLCCALYSGACCEFLETFDSKLIWEKFANDISLFMAVPTIYVKLIKYWQTQSDQRKIKLSEYAKRLRLMVSGSAALPVSVLEEWKIITGHTLLERYGMTEIGMALSNSYQGLRKAGTVGLPLPGVAVVLGDDNGNVQKNAEQGEILIKGKNVFLEYWNRPKETAQQFVDGWFRTGDIAEIKDGYYRILGRNSIDIIKTGGYKVSALEIEEVLRMHPFVEECAVVGAEDPEWGERVCAAIIPANKNANLELKELRSWCGKKLAAYKLPSALKLVEDLPRNIMGKVQKSKLKELFSNED